MPDALDRIKLTRRKAVGDAATAVLGFGVITSVTLAAVAASGHGGGGGDTITSPNSTLNVGGTSSNTTLDINLSNPNSWLALQKFTAAADFSGAVDTGAFSLGTSGSDAVISSGPSGKLYLANAGTNFWYMGFGGNVLPTNDNYNFIGSSALRVKSFNGGSFNSYLNAGDTYPATQLLGGGAGAISLLFGPGGASPPNIGFQYANQTGVLYLTSPIAATTVRLAIFGSTVGVGLPQSELTFYGMPGANGEFLYFVAYQQSSYIWNTGAVGGGANRPQIWQSGGSEAFRITTTPTVQMQPTALTVLGSSTGYTTLTTANASATDYTATFPANTGTVAELNLAQSWTALQTFGDEHLLRRGAAQRHRRLATGNVLSYNGTNWVNATPSSGGPTTYRQSILNSDHCIGISRSTSTLLSSFTACQHTSTTSMRGSTFGALRQAGTVSNRIVAPRGIQGTWAVMTRLTRPAYTIAPSTSFSTAVTC